MSQAALVLTSPSMTGAALVPSTTCEWSVTGKRGASSGSCSACSVVRIGLVKKEPADQVSWSVPSSTIPLERRSSRTASRSSRSGTRSPNLTPSAPASWE